MKIIQKILTPLLITAFAQQISHSAIASGPSLGNTLASIEINNKQKKAMKDKVVPVVRLELENI